MDNKTVSIIIPNFNGQALLEKCIASIKKLEYDTDNLECIVVDNNSEDGSKYYLKQFHPWIKLIELDRNYGFAGAINEAAHHASGDILVLLNNDTLADKRMVTELVSPIVLGHAVCTGAKILDFTGKRVLYAGGGMNFHGIAFQWGEGELDADRFNHPRDELFACGAAMAISKEVFISCGEFDNDFFAYFEDVDLGWRLWKQGQIVKYIPTAIAYHRQSATSKFFDDAKLRLLYIKNPLIMIYKNYDSGHFQDLFSAGLMLTIRRMFNSSDIPKNAMGDFEDVLFADFAADQAWIEIPPTGKSSISDIAVADMLAMNQILSDLPNLQSKRSNVQDSYIVPDSELIHLFRDPLRPAESDNDYKNLHNQLINLYSIDQIFKEITQ